MLLLLSNHKNPTVFDPIDICRLLFVISDLFLKVFYRCIKSLSPRKKYWCSNCSKKTVNSVVKRCRNDDSLDFIWGKCKEACTVVSEKLKDTPCERRFAEISQYLKYYKVCTRSRSSHPKLFYKSVFQNCVNFTRESICWSLYLNKVLEMSTVTLSKRDSVTGVFQWILCDF